jgi:hypothetical protein
MIGLNQEYFQTPYYFFLKEKGDKIAVYYAVSDTITESRKTDDVIVVDKEVFEEIQKVISKILNSGKKLTKEFVHNLLDKKAKSKQKPDGELGELVNPDGSIVSSSIPILNQRNLAKKTMDQTVRMTRVNQFPWVRVYYGESKEEDGKLLDEVDQSESFGWEETEYARTYDEADEIMKDTLKVEDPIQRRRRLARLGFSKKLDKELTREKRNGRCKKCFTKRRLSELEKEKMEKMIDEILISKKSKDKDFVKKTKDSDGTESVIEKLLLRNLEAVKKLADKEDIDIEKLLKQLKKGE